MTGQLVDLIRFGYRFYYDNKIDDDFTDYYSSVVECSLLSIIFFATK